MKFIKKFAVAATTAATLFATVAGGLSSTVSADSIPTKVTKKTTITFWNGMSGNQQKALQTLTQEFEKENPNITVKLENQGQYKDLQSKITSTLQSPKNLPTITQAYPGWLYNASKNDLLVDLKPYINNSKIGWGSAAKSGIKPSLMKGAQINGTQYGIPFNKSVEVLVYNKTMLDKYGVKVPTTMAQLKSAAKTIYEKSNHQVVGAGFDSLSNYYVLGMKNEGVDFTSKINLTSAKSKKVIDYYADGIKGGYFKTAGSQGYLSGDFANQKVAMFIGTSAGESFVKKGVNGKFDYEVAPRPGKWNMQQGTDIYMFKNASKEQRTAAFMYIKFLTSKKSQLYWAQQTGYIPVSQDVINSSEYKNNKDSKVPAQVEAATKNLYTVPVTKNSNAAYQQMNTIMQNILSHAKNGNLNSLIKQGESQFKNAWNQ